MLCRNCHDASQSGWYSISNTKCILKHVSMAFNSEVAGRAFLSISTKNWRDFCFKSQRTTVNGCGCTVSSISPQKDLMFVTFCNDKGCINHSHKCWLKERHSWSTDRWTNRLMADIRMEKVLANNLFHNIYNKVLLLA